MKKMTLMMLLLVWATSAAATPDEGSVLLSGGVGSVLASPLLSLQGKPVEASTALSAGTVFSVIGISQLSAQSLQVILENSRDGSRFVVHVGSHLAKQIGLTTGSIVEASAETSGHLLISSGKVLAFIPNQIGQALLHQKRMP